MDKVRFTPEIIKDLKEEHGSYAYAAMFDQAPVPREGGMVKESWFKNRFGEDATPANLRKRKGLVMVVQSADCASKAKERNDPTVLETYGVFQDPVSEEAGKRGLITHHVELWDVTRGKYEFPDALRMFKHQAEVWEPDLVLIEDKDAGQQLLQVLSADKDYGWKLEACDPEGLDKGTRMSAETATIERGEFWLPESASWLQAFITELCLFTGNNAGGKDDQVDSASQFLKWFRRKFKKRRLVGPAGDTNQGSAHDIV